jgi:hypothetical protein
MPYWPLVMAVAAGLTAWGWRHNAWEIPAIVFCGYVLMRLVVTYVPPEYIEVTACASWLFFAALMVYRGGELPGFLYALSGLTYPVLLVFGRKLEYMGLASIVAETFAALALLSIGGGVYGMANPPRDSSRPLAWLQGHSVGVALRQSKADCGVQGYSEILTGTGQGND